MALFAFAIASIFGWDVSATLWETATQLIGLARSWLGLHSHHLFGACLIAVLLALTAFAAIWPIRLLKRPKRATSKGSKSLLPDAPIEKPDKDKFQYGHLADKLAQFVCLDVGAPSTVIALNDRWGLGKTSTLNLLRLKLQARTTPPIIIDFHPWLVGTKQSLVQYFLVQFAAGISDALQDAHPQEVRRLTSHLISLAEALPGTLATGEQWKSISSVARRGLTGASSESESVSELSLSSQKRRVIESVKALARPIVVILDDIDRLTGEEILAVMQLVKAVCDFPGVCYLLALDHDRAAARLDEFVGESGREYLEKIVQADISLPPLTLVSRQNHIRDLVQTVVDRYQELPDSLAEDLDDAIKILARLLATPRDATRFLNRLLLDDITGVFFPDQIVYAGLSMKYPSIGAEIRRFPMKFASYDMPNAELNLTMQEYIAESLDKKEEVDEQYVKALLERVDIEHRDTAQTALSFLFPRFGSHHRTYRQNNEQSARLYDRASRYPTLLKLIKASGYARQYSSADAVLFLTSPDERSELLNTHVISFEDGNFLSYVRTFLEESGVSDPIGLATTLMRFAGVAYVNHQIDVADDVASLLLTLFAAKKAPADRAGLLKEICGIPASLSSVERLLVEITRQSGQWRSGDYVADRDSSEAAYSLSPTEIAAAVQRWVETARARAATDDIFESEPNPLSVLFRWGQFGNDYEPVKDYLGRLMSKDSVMTRLLRLFNAGTSLEGMEKIVPDFTALRSFAGQHRDKFPAAWGKLQEHVAGNE